MKTEQNILIAEKYCLALSQKDIVTVGDFLHEKVSLNGPLTCVEGKEAVIKASSAFMTFFKTLTMLEKFSNDNGAILLYDIERYQPSGCYRAVAYLQFDSGLISAIELFYDPRPFLP